MFTLKTVYFAYFHATVECGIFWRNSINSRKVILQQKRIIRIMTCSISRTPWKPLFQRSELLTLSSQCILLLMRFLSQNLEIYTFNFTIHDFNTGNKLQLHELSTTLKIYQKGAHSIKIFNKWPEYIAEPVLRKKCFT